MIHMRAFNEFEIKNIKYLTQKNIEFTLVHITATGYKKSILDATDPMRQYFKECGMHDYSLQLQGQDHKVLKTTVILDETSAYNTSTSLYRPETKKGDPRIWANNLKKYCEPNDILLMTYFNDKLYIVNLSKVDIVRTCDSSIITPLKELVVDSNAVAMGIANELTGLLRDIAQEWHPAEVLADTGIGRAIESILGIDMNSSKLPDYKGIELKSYRDKRPQIRATLFCQVPDWKNSHLKSAKEIVAKYGYLRENRKGELVRTYATTQSTSTLLKESITEYYLSTSNTTLSGGAWDTTPYTPTPGKYIWQRTRTVTNAGETKYSNPICVSDEAYSVMMTSDVLLLKCNSDGQVI